MIFGFQAMIFISTWFESSGFHLHHISFPSATFRPITGQSITAFIILKVQRANVRAGKWFPRNPFLFSFEHLSADWRMERHIDIIKHWFWCSDLLSHCTFRLASSYFVSLYSNFYREFFFLVLHSIEYFDWKDKPINFRFVHRCQDVKVHQSNCWLLNQPFFFCSSEELVDSSWCLIW